MLKNFCYLAYAISIIFTMHLLKIVNGRAITPYRVLPNATLLISGGRIIAVSEGDLEAPGATVIDAKGQYVSPGFIDLHIHGGDGHDFMDGTEEAFHAIANLHARHGTTAMTPTTLSAGKQELIDTLETYERLAAQQRAAQFLGMHLE